MFDLENSIAEWRKRMLAAGIKSPVPLEELECHLREEIERQIQSGASGQEAFQRTVLQIGQARELKAEFVKVANLLSFLGTDKFTRIDRILGALWLVLCSSAFVVISGEVIHHLTMAVPGQHPPLLLGLLLWATYGAGILGSVLAIRGSKPGRLMVGIIAAFFTLIALFILFHLIPTIHHDHVVRATIFTAFYAITAWLMFLPSHPDVKLAR